MIAAALGVVVVVVVVLRMLAARFIVVGTNRSELNQLNRLTSPYNATLAPVDAATALTVE